MLIDIIGNSSKLAKIIISISVTYFNCMCDYKCTDQYFFIHNKYNKFVWIYIYKCKFQSSRYPGKKIWIDQILFLNPIAFTTWFQNKVNGDFTMPKIW